MSRNRKLRQSQIQETAEQRGLSRRAQPFDVCECCITPARQSYEDQKSGATRKVKVLERSWLSRMGTETDPRPVGTEQIGWQKRFSRIAWIVGGCEPLCGDGSVVGVRQRTDLFRCKGQAMNRYG
jgi:hypothetical protein